MNHGRWLQTSRIGSGFNRGYVTTNAEDIPASLKHWSEMPALAFFSIFSKFVHAHCCCTEGCGVVIRLFSFNALRLAVLKVMSSLSILA